MRYLLKEELKLNQPEASDGWLTEDALWLVSKTVSDKLRAHLLSEGIDGIPTNNTAVFNVLQDHGILQPTSDGKAVWRATVTSATGWSHSFTLLRLAPALIWEAGERPASFTGTVAIDAAAIEKDAGSEAAPPMTAAKPVLEEQTTPPWEGSSPANLASPPAVQPLPDVMEDMLAMVGSGHLLATRQDAEPVPAFATSSLVLPVPASKSSASTQQPSGEHFMGWLRHGLQSRKLILNDAKALVHTVDDTVFLVSPGVFQRYVQEHPQVPALAKQDAVVDWQWVQKRFEKLQVHRKQPSSLNIWTCEVTGPRKSRKLHGYLLDDPGQLFDERPPNNPYLKLA